MTSSQLKEYLIERYESAKYAGMDEANVPVPYLKAMIQTLVKITWDDQTEEIYELGED